jgi:Flp pilus assembly protein TadG
MGNRREPRGGDAVTERRPSSPPPTPTTGNSTDRGSVTLELAILAPALILTLLLIIAAGRVAQAHQAVEAAARDAARQASIARDPATARTNALTSARSTLTREGLSCPAQVTIDTSGFAQPLGEPATVTAHVTCTVHLADIALLSGVPATTVTASFASPLDPYRSRSLGFATPPAHASGSTSRTT